MRFQTALLDIYAFRRDKELFTLLTCDNYLIITTHTQQVTGEGTKPLLLLCKHHCSTQCCNGQQKNSRSHYNTWQRPLFDFDPSLEQTKLKLKNTYLFLV